MKTSWLNQQGNDSCILFFAGWGMDPNPFTDIPLQEHDLLIFYDYSELAPIDLLSILDNRYDSLHLVAWSMGVWALAHMAVDNRKSFATATAINGTLAPIDDQNGIGVETYKTMAENFTPTALEDFYISMFSDESETERFIRNRPTRSPESILGELVSLQNLYARYGQAENCYTKKIVGSRDRIFPARNQTRSWGKDNCTLLKIPHFPFYGWPSWDFLIRTVTQSK